MVTMWKKALVNGELNNKELKRTQKELEEKEKALESALMGHWETATDD